VSAPATAVHARAAVIRACPLSLITVVIRLNRRKFWEI
jgi:hypothetical protein